MLIALFVLATLLPYLIAARLAGGDRPVTIPDDRWRFEVVIAGTGVLYGILHALVFVGALSVVNVAAGGALVAVAAWLAVRQHAGGAADAAPGALQPEGFLERSEWFGALAATLVVAAVCGVWMLQSAAGLEISGTDADHYHIPHAVNYALGATPWDPMPTPHVYPMGTSVLFAWFIVPFGDAFLVDGAMLVWYLVLLVALASLFRDLTGRDGWAWTPWFALVLIPLPLIRGAMYPSSDLPYAASFLALAAQLTWMVRRQAGSARDWAVAGVTLGLLIGCKTTGAYSAALLAGAAAIAQLAARRPSRWPRLSSWIVPIAIVTSTCLVTGGIWLVRNAWMFGQPVDFVTNRYYASILSDVRDAFGGDWLRFVGQTRARFAQWLGPYFLALGVATAWMVVESAVLVVRRRHDTINTTRTWFVGLMLVVAAIHIVGLVGAPWTSLEFTNGLSLRYVLPLWILYGLLALVALFSRWFQWHERWRLRSVVWTITAVGTTWYASRLSGLGSLRPDAGRWTGLAAMGLVLAVFWVIGRGGMRRGSGWRGMANPIGSAVVLMVVAGLSAAWLEVRHARLHAGVQAHEWAEFGSWRGGAPAEVDPTYRQVYLEVRADEVRRGEVCTMRRFFIASRFDAPLALQPATYSSLLFDSRRMTDLGLRLIRQGGRPGTCDYAIVRRDEPNRPLIRESADWLRPVTATGPYLSYSIHRPQ